MLDRAAASGHRLAGRLIGTALAQSATVSYRRAVLARPSLLVLAAGLAGAAGLQAPTARADLARFDLAGRIYTKWLYQNDDSQGTLTHGNPFWPDNFSGSNGVGSEFELKVTGTVSNAVRAEVRLQSRFGALWQDWWEQGDQSYSELNTSGESAGMNHAEYIKLRGYRVDANLPIPSVRSLLIGSTDLGMFNPWTIGKVRYIDRDNAKGTILTGGTDDGAFGYVLAMVALPKLFVGPGWSTGIGDQTLRYPFYSRDWAYAAKLEYQPLDIGSFTLIGSLTRDHEIDLADPDAQGSLQPECKDGLGHAIPECQKDHAVETVGRYTNLVTTLQYRGTPVDGLGLDALLAVSYSDLNEDVTFNGVAGNQGVFPIVYKDVPDLAAVLRVELFDPFDIGLTLRFEGFSIGEHFNSIFAARREADVLLTEGFVEGGQLPTLNLANEFVDFDEPWVESCIGWYGLTLVPELEVDLVKLYAEGTWLGYHTDGQDRDVDEVYPDFLHTDGFTDTDLYDYANTIDRGRDPRSVYRRNQARSTAIALFGARLDLDAGIGLTLDLKAKGIWDFDTRSETTGQDDYRGQRYIAALTLGARPVEGLSVSVGTRLEHWDEENRRGTLELGYGDDTSFKAKTFLALSYIWAGLNLRYQLEYLHKDQRREREPDQLWHVVRSKATLEVAW
jgi:hypothetical protein